MEKEESQEIKKSPRTVLQWLTSTSGRRPKKIGSWDDLKASLSSVQPRLLTTWCYGKTGPLPVVLVASHLLLPVD